MRANGFGRSVVFAAIAGAAWPAFALAASPLLGTSTALSLYLIGAAAIYVAGIAPSLARGVPAAFVAAVLASLLVAIAGTPGAAALGAAIAIGVARSGLLYRSNPARALAIEVALLGGGLVLARFLLAPGALGVALALWGFFLVQSAFFAIGGLRARDPQTEDRDRFECARRRALALLEDEG